MKRLKRTRLIQSDRYVVAVEVELVIPVDDPSEPCYEAETIQHLKDVRDQADRGNLAWLQQHGKVYESVTAGA
jgi:hypothetical protein